MGRHPSPKPRRICTIRYLDASGRQVPKDTPSSRRVKVQSRNYFADIYPDGKRTRVALQTADLGVAWERLRKILRAAEITALDPFAEHRGVPLSMHVAAWKASLETGGGTKKHVELATSRVLKVFQALGWKLLRDIHAEGVKKHLSDLRKQGLAIQTANHYLTHLKAFCRWVSGPGKRCEKNPLAFLSASNVAVDLRVRRRAMTEVEITDLLSNLSGVVFRLGPEDRKQIYLIALYTGYRASEIASLERKSFRLDAEPATITVEAKNSKRRRRDIQPVHISLVAGLREYLANKGEGRLFGGSWSQHAAAMIRHDLKAAKIASESPIGVLDFHALRHTFVTRLVRADLHPREAQKLARHSTIRLTMDHYAHTTQAEAASALNRLPGLNEEKTDG